MDIIILYFLLRNLGNIAKEKGQPSLQWKIFGLLAWVCGEITGFLLVITFIGKEYFLFSLFFGLGMAYLFFLLVKSKLQGLPDDSEN